MTILRKISITLGVLLILGVAAAWIWLKPQTDIGAGYAAKQLCSCIYIGGRSLAECRADQDARMQRMTVREVPELRGVHAEFFPLSDATAYYFKGTGCTLD